MHVRERHENTQRNVTFYTINVLAFKGLTLKITLHFVKMHPKFHLRYAILVRKSQNVMITLQKYQENPLKISFCF